MAPLKIDKRQPRHVHPKNSLRIAESRLVRIHKLLTRLRSMRRGAKSSGNEWDVLANVEAAIKIARLGQRCSAEEATECVDQTELFWLLIDTQIDCLLAQLGQARPQ